MYRVKRLAPGSYDLELDGEVVGSVVRSGQDQHAKWHAELLAPEAVRPAPFTEAEHEFRSLEELVQWLGDAELSPRGRATRDERGAVVEISTVAGGRGAITDPERPLEPVGDTIGLGRRPRRHLRRRRNLSSAGWLPR